jgi:hypothetical protein
MRNDHETHNETMGDIARRGLREDMAMWLWLLAAAASGACLGVLM